MEQKITGRKLNAYLKISGGWFCICAALSVITFFVYIITPFLFLPLLNCVFSLAFGIYIFGGYPKNKDTAGTVACISLILEYAILFICSVVLFIGDSFYLNEEAQEVTYDLLILCAASAVLLALAICFTIAFKKKNRLWMIIVSAILSLFIIVALVYMGIAYFEESARADEEGFLEALIMVLYLLLLCKTNKISLLIFSISAFRK